MAYKLDLFHFLAQAEANYHGIMHLLPSQAGTRAVSWACGREGQLKIEILEQFRYTSDLTVALLPREARRWRPKLVLHVRVYHDAKIAEVLSFQSQKTFAPDYEYPNADMLHPDEKAQCNRFLSEWLHACLGEQDLTAKAMNYE